ncbi:hypothetical protein [Phascolarctobacterium succinatutens]|uniref:hypothetical protein n=1 Tax=Phascolarctobacterium succinatutens TaxID=626940 RepID=UPI0026E9B583|nr:hypothetical protein [Phascolarctobacterium succinatutens]
MRKTGLILAGLLLWNMALASAATQAEAANPTCILMKFTDDTRYDRIESAASLSDLVMEKLIMTGKFNLKETKPIDAQVEELLYDEKARELQGVKQALDYGDYTAMFEGAGFNESKAQSIATAQVGQYISPAITSEIGRHHGAEYLLQGTIINLGVGEWWDGNLATLSQTIGYASGMMGSGAANAMAATPLGILGSMSVERTGIGVQSDMRIIKASTGEVVWSKRVVGIGDQKQFGIGFLTVGSTELNANLYAKAMDKAAQNIVDALVADLDAKRLFLK